MDTRDDRSLLDFRWGVERETHRVLANGSLSAARHPEALQGPRFTRDFAETMLEIVTAPMASLSALEAELEALTRQAQGAVAPELLWPFSVPPRLPAEADIAVADLSRRAKLYRQGLALRYGKARQMIAGVHLNVSFGEGMTAWLNRTAALEADEGSFELRLARNLYQDMATFMPLFGASPVRAEGGPLAISHRNGPSGYARAGFLPYLDLTSLPAYLDGLRRGLRTLSPGFAALGLVKDGRVLQLNGNVFQAEKEFYAPIRLRQAPLPGESGLQALSRRGVSYLELRFLDVDPCRFTGVSAAGLRLMHLFILEALLRPTGPRDGASLGEDLRRSAEVAGMDPLKPLDGDCLANLRTRLAALEGWARRLDALVPGAPYVRALEGYQACAQDPLQLPSARLAQRFQDAGGDWTAFGIQTALLQTKGVRHELDYTGI